MALIELKNISKIYGFGDATTVALEEVNLDIDKGEFVAVVGPSGCGKSTLMNIIGMLDRPSHGTYMFNKRAVSGFNDNRRAKIRRDTVGFIYQSFNMLPRLTLLDNVALPLAYKGMTETRRLNRASAILEQMGLLDREYFMPPHLSGGQLQRGAIARAIVNNPSIIIADEPTGNLDSESSRLVMEILSDIHKDGGTIILVTHNPELTRYASRVVFMHDGLVIGDEHSKPGEIPGSLRRTMYFMRERNEEDDLAGVSALMQALPDKNDKPRKLRKNKKTTKKLNPHKEGSKKYVSRRKKEETNDAK